MSGTLSIDPAALAMPDTGVTLAFTDSFAMSATIIETLRDLAPDERAETIADLLFVAMCSDEDTDTVRAQREFFRTLTHLFDLEADNPEAATGDSAWHAIRHVERRAALHLSSADIRDIHLPGCATFLVD